MNNATYQADIQKVMNRHVQSFVHMVTEGEKSYTAAWEVIVSRTSFGPDLRAKLSDMCVAAATEAFAKARR